MEGPTPEELAHEVDRLRQADEERAHELDRLRQAVSRLEIEQAQQTQQYARRDLVDERLKATAALTAEKFAAIYARLDGHDTGLEQVFRDARDREQRADAKDAARRNIVYAGLVAGIVGLATAAIQVGVLG